MINFQDKMQNLEKSTQFEISTFIQQWLTHNMWYIGVTICILNNFIKEVVQKYFIWLKNGKEWKKTL
jgi:hypothetical protein